MTPTPTPDAVEEDADVVGTVPFMLSLRLSSQLTEIGSLIPGLARDYDATLGATVTSTAGNATLSVADTTNGSGRLANGDLELAQPLQARATNATTQNTAFAPITGAENPLTLLTYNTWVTNDAVTIMLRQRILANEPLLAGGYGKTITFTLSTVNP